MHGPEHQTSCRCGVVNFSIMGIDNAVDSARPSSTDSQKMLYLAY